MVGSLAGPGNEFVYPLKVKPSPPSLRKQRVGSSAPRDHLSHASGLYPTPLGEAAKQKKVPPPLREEAKKEKGEGNSSSGFGSLL